MAEKIYTKDRKLYICKQKGPLKMAAEKENLHLLFSPTRYKLTHRVLSGVGRPDAWRGNMLLEAPVSSRKCIGILLSTMCTNIPRATALRGPEY
jgi:hypothetical protein